MNEKGDLDIPLKAAYKLCAFTPNFPRLNKATTD